MNLRRILSATLTAIWLLPVALAGGVALHVAFDHDFGQGEIAHAATLPEALEHGHAHAGESTDHEHRLVTAPSIAVRVGAASVPPSELVAGVGSGLGAPGALAGGVASPPARPPRASGTALLALLAIFRI